MSILPPQAGIPAAGDGLPPSPAADARPAISAQEASWHITVAGIRARRAAEAAGASPEARHALALAAADPTRPTGPIVAGHPAPHISLGTLWAFEASAPLAPAVLAAAGSAAAGLGLTAATILYPEDVLLAALAGDIPALRRRALAAALATTPQDFAALQAHYHSELARLHALAPGDAPEKPPAAASTSRPPTSPHATASAAAPPQDGPAPSSSMPSPHGPATPSGISSGAPLHPHGSPSPPPPDTAKTPATTAPPSPTAPPSKPAKKPKPTSRKTTTSPHRK